MTWERFAKGRTLVGVDENDVDFASAGLELGEKEHQLTVDEMPSHNHSVRYYNGNVSDYLGGSTASYGLASDDTHITGRYRAVLDSAGSDQPHNNIQPSTTVYYWRRVS